MRRLTTDWAVRAAVAHRETAVLAHIDECATRRNKIHGPHYAKQHGAERSWLGRRHLAGRIVVAGPEL
jgi:hypothetical protein